MKTNIVNICRAGRRPAVIGLLLMASGPLALQLLTATAFAQGPLTPPGAPAPTMKTLEQVEPRTAITNLPVTISEPGSYYFVTNLTGATGITIAASGVTLDLMGFELVGGTGAGIIVTGSRTNIAVRNGTVRGWSGDGVDTLSSRNIQLERLRVTSNGSRGIVAGNGSTVSGCTAQSNGSAGIEASNGSTVSGCTARNNFGNGIFAATGCTVSGCSASSNTGAGILVWEGSTVSGCIAQSNGSNGILADTGSTVSGCTASFNTSDGIRGAGDGITVSDCTAADNTGDGISTTSGSTVKDCTAYSNTGVGISTGTGSTVSGCAAHGNTSDGIFAVADCRVVDNTCDSNGSSGDGAGIHVTFADNRIDGNNVTDNDWGIKADTAGNLIIRNSASGNTTNYFFTGTHTFGPTNTVTGEINPTNTSPWANFSF